MDRESWDGYLGTDRWCSGRTGYHDVSPSRRWIKLLRLPLGLAEQLLIQEAKERALLRYPPLPLPATFWE